MFWKPAMTIFVILMNVLHYSKFDITTGASVDEIRDSLLFLITFIVTLLLDNVLFVYSTVLL